MFHDQLATAIENAGRNQLDDYSRQLWKAHGAGLVADDQAQQLQELIQSRRGTSSFRTSVATATEVLIPRYLIQRSAEQRSPDRRASIRRRREHTAAGPLPPHLARHYTYGQVAVLRIVADEWLAHGACDRSLNELGARAGVSRKVAKQAVRLAERDGLITVQRRPRSGRKHLTNVIRVVRAEWVDWLHKGRRKAYAVGACNRAKPIFAEAGGVLRSPPRSEIPGNSDRERVDKSVEKRNRSGPSRAALYFGSK
jgi:hypothetical protein